MSERDEEIRAAAPILTVLVVTSDMHNTPCWAIKEALEAKGYQVERTSVVNPGDVQVDLGPLGDWP